MIHFYWAPTRLQNLHRNCINIWALSSRLPAWKGGLTRKPTISMLCKVFLLRKHSGFQGTEILTMHPGRCAEQGKVKRE